MNSRLDIGESPNRIVVVALFFVVGLAVGLGLEIGLWSVWIAIAMVALAVVLRRRSVVYLAVMVCGVAVGALDVGAREGVSINYSSESRVDGSLGEHIGSWAAQRLKRLGLSDEAQALSEAQLLGRREMLTEEVVQSYRGSGAAHLLAVSGLHIGIVAMIFNLLLSPLALLHRGNIARVWIVVVAMWIYAIVVGLTPSVVRSAMMFTALSLSLLSLRRYDSMNILASVVVMMLLIEPMVLYNVGFQLSVVAVAAILLWALPIWYKLGGNSLMEWLLLPIIIGLCCTVATAPIVAYTFGYVAIWGVILNPLLLLTTTLLLGVSLVWIVAGFGVLAPLFRWVIELCAATQNYLVGELDRAVEVEIGGATVALFYVAFALMTLYFREKK